MKTARGFDFSVYEVVQRIPRGRVLTYGQVARRLGSPRGARAVGWALRRLPARMERSVPWHRVVASGGRLSPRVGFGAQLQRRLLLSEGVRFQAGAVDLTRYGWLA